MIVAERTEDQSSDDGEQGDAGYSPNAFTAKHS